MAIITKTNLKKNVANFFGAFGYLFCSLQWLWAIALNFILINALVLFVSPDVTKIVTKTPPVGADLGSSIFFMITATVVTIIMITLTLYILVKIPSTIVRKTKKAVHSTAENVTPIVLRIQHRKDTKRNHKKLSLRLIIVLKIILITIPVILSFLSQFMGKQIVDSYIAMYVSLWLACFSILFFAFQYFLASLFLVKKQDIW